MRYSFAVALKVSSAPTLIANCRRLTKEVARPSAILLLSLAVSGCMHLDKRSDLKVRQAQAAAPAATVDTAEALNTRDSIARELEAVSEVQKLNHRRYKPYEIPAQDEESSGESDILSADLSATQTK